MSSTIDVPWLGVKGDVIVDDGPVVDLVDPVVVAWGRVSDDELGLGCHCPKFQSGLTRVPVREFDAQVTDHEDTPKPATEFTAALNATTFTALSFDDDGDFERANRGLIARHPTGLIGNEADRVVWDIEAHDFIRDQDEAPDTVNPSLWRQAQLNCVHGLFEVMEGVWQVRGYDLSNVTFIASDSGWIVIDPLTSAETAAAALALANEHLGERTVKAVIYTHSHVDHFGGVHGVITEEQVESGEVEVIAPTGFMKEAVSENVIAGPAMIRRSAYMYGGLLPRSERGHVDAGLGKATPLGTVGLIPPTVDIETTGTELVVDGIRIVFQYTPDAEAPAEMNFHFPDMRLLCMAENCSHNMHNVYTPRGAQVRDSLAWSKYINEAIDLFADDTDIVFASHHWPRWGAEDGRVFLETQRDVYRWLHDQTMRLANHGNTPLEIAEQLSLPSVFTDQSHVREYYGTVSHNAKAVYQRYLGFFDGNPANLHPLPPVESAVRYVEFMGGAEAVLDRAREYFERGEYRWVAQVVNHVVFAEPDNKAARSLQADTLEQLGYQAESGPWRNFYLTGAMELRHGTPNLGPARISGFLGSLSVEQVFDALGVRLNADEIGDDEFMMNWVFPDIEEQHVLGVSRRALVHSPGRADPDAAVTVTMNRAVLGEILGGGVEAFGAALEAERVVIDGDGSTLVTFFGALDQFQRGFAIVTPD